MIEKLKLASESEMPLTVTVIVSHSTAVFKLSQRLQ